jgi:hypothetical protein
MKIVWYMLFNLFIDNAAHEKTPLGMPTMQRQYLNPPPRLGTTSAPARVVRISDARDDVM